MDLHQSTLACMSGAILAEADETAKNTKTTALEVASLRAELEQTRQELASYKAEQAQSDFSKQKVDDAKWLFTTLLSVAAFIVSVIAL